MPSSRRSASTFPRTRSTSSSAHRGLAHRRADGRISCSTSPDPVTTGAVEANAHGIAGYFVEEVLSRQPRAGRRLHAGDLGARRAVGTGLHRPGRRRRGPAARTPALAHLFVSVTDEGARYYRYHQLIKDVLQDEPHPRDPNGKPPSTKRRRVISWRPVTPRPLRGTSGGRGRRPPRPRTSRSSTTS